MTKIPTTPPLSIDNKFAINIQTKANIFDTFFAKRCTPLKNDSILPKCQTFLTQSWICSLDLNKDEIYKIIRALNIMVKICDKSLLKSLTPLFEYSVKKSCYQYSVKKSCYPDMYKIPNITPVHKSDDTQLVTNYPPISLLPIFSKIFEKIIFNRIYNFLLEENVLNLDQSGFCPFDSCVNQLIAITHVLFGAFDCNPPLEVRSVFLDISKAFDKVWDKGLL